MSNRDWWRLMTLSALLGIGLGMLARGYYFEAVVDLSGMLALGMLWWPRANANP